jgi:signal transduction histidine kinase/CheY-like chemotaxis protein
MVGGQPGGTQVHLRDANERLVLATVKAQSQAEAAELAVEHMAQMAKLEAHLQEVQKQETLVVLAGGVAHDFNNLLTTIVGNADLGTLAVEAAGNPLPYFQAIEKAAMRAGDLTRQLLAYAGKGKRIESEVDLTVLVREILLLLHVSIPEQVTLTCDLPDRLPFVWGDATQIFQVLMNLITNAGEAFAPGAKGHITLRTLARTLTVADLAAGGWVLAVPTGAYASLEVADDGLGMAPEVMARIFEPFFTTKFTGRGLGLAAAIGILRNHGGGLRVQTTPGAGTSFQVFLPAMREQRSVPTLEFLPPWRGAGLILLAEASGPGAVKARAMAENRGFTVLEAGTGREALACFRKHHGDLALVVVAATLPGMGGREAFQRMRHLDGRVPVVMSTRFDGPSPDPGVDGLAGIVHEPYRVAEFEGLLKRVLGPRNPVPAAAKARSPQASPGGAPPGRPEELPGP